MGKGRGEGKVAEILFLIQKVRKALKVTRSPGLEAED